LSKNKYKNRKKLHIKLNLNLLKTRRRSSLLNASIVHLYGGLERKRRRLTKLDGGEYNNLGSGQR